MIQYRADGRLHFVLPKETYGENPAVTIDLYRGAIEKFATGTPTAIDEAVMKLVKSGITESCEMPQTPGVYTYHVHGEGCYSLFKMLYLREAELTAGKTVLVQGGRRNGTGYEPGELPPEAPADYKPDIRDQNAFSLSDEILKSFSIADQHYATPAFTLPHAAESFTTQEEMVAFVDECVAKNEKLHRYSCGRTVHYGFDMPLIVATESVIGKDASLEEAAAIVRANGKPTVFQEAQIHSNEVAAGEGALVMLHHFACDEEYISLLRKINVVIVPRIHPESAYIYGRKTYDGFDPNRDHVELKAREPEMLHAAWRLFMPEVVVDNHEFSYFFFDNQKEELNHITDLEVSASNNLNDDPAVEKLALDICSKIFDAAENEGIRADHYGVAIAPSVGRFYYGMYNSLSFLVETRGIGAARENFERRVRAQEITTTTVLRETAAHAREIYDTVAAARRAVIEKGRSYDEKNIFVLQQTRSGDTKTTFGKPLYTAKADGTVRVKEEKSLMPLNDTVLRARPRPTAYLIPCDAPKAEKIAAFLDSHGLEYGILPGGASVTVQQYRYESDFIEKEKVLGVIAAPEKAAETVFPKGAYLCPMDQVGATLLAAVCEPDVGDYHEHRGTLVTLGLIEKNGDGTYPLYRYTGSDPRSLIR